MSFFKQGYITQKSEKRPNTQGGGPSELLTYDEFHPMLFRQFEKKKYLEFDTFNKVSINMLMTVLLLKSKQVVTP